MKFAGRLAFMAKVIFFTILMGFAVNLFAQKSQGGTPPSFEEGRSINAVDNYSVDELTIYPPDVEALRLEDKNRGKNGLPPRIGINVPVNAGLNTAGSWTTRPDGSKVWILKISSDGALAMNLIFDDFYLAPGTKMFMYNESKKQVLGAFTHKNNNEHGRFTTTKIQGETVYIEYYEPAKVVDNSRFSIQDAGYFYNASKQIVRLNDTYGDEQAQEKTVGASDDCEVNINCSPVGDDWQDEKRGVAKISFLAGGSWYMCTGSLVNNTAYDETPYFLTAFHCGAADASDTELLSWEFLFNYESPDCTDPATEPATDDIIGATRIAEGNINGGSDFFLLQLESTPDGTYSPYYNGWDNTGNTSPTGVGIHHPAGDIKKISTYGTIAPSGSNNISGDVMAANSSWSVTWEENDNGWGVTEGGSSGSPLFRDNGLVIGTLTGGSSFCTDQTASDVYGRFEYHWTSNGTTDAEQLQPWLDPANSGATTLDGYDPFATAPPTVAFSADRYNILEGDAVNFSDESLSPSGPITAWDWTFNGATPANSTDENPAGIIYNTAGTYDVGLSVTNANGTSSETETDMINVLDPSVTTCDTLSQWCCNPSVYTSAEGYVSGTNEYDIQEVAEYFPDAYPYNTLTGARFYFAQVTSGTNPDITFKVYSDNAGQPDQVLTSTTVPLSTIETSYNADGYYDLVLPESVAYPDNAFYIGFTVPGTQASGDTIALATNDDGDSDANTGYSLYDGTWETFSAWGMTLQNMVFPNVCHDVSLAPVAAFEGVPQMVNAGNAVDFTDQSFGGTPDSWSWTFDGGTPGTSTDQNPTITYDTPGVYSVSLTVGNANGSDTKTVNGYITVVDPNTCACSQLGHVVGGEMLYATADGYLSGTNEYTDNAKAEYFDDYGTATNLEGAYFHFGRAFAANTGTMITFNVYADDGGASAGGTYNYSPGTILETVTVPLDDIVADVNNGDSTYIAFDPPMDITGNFFIGFEIPYAGDSLGILTGAQDAGTDDGWEQWSDNDWYSMTGAGWGGSFNMAIYPVVCTEGAPLPEFSADNTSIMAGGTVNFTDMSTCGATSWDWTFDGGTPANSTDQNPSVVYNTAGVYDVSLVSTNAQGSNPMLKTDYITVLQPIVWWDFPNNPDDALSDGGIAVNDGTKSLTVSGGVSLDAFNATGATTQAAEASGWDAGANTKAWVVEFETTDYANLKLSSKQSGDNRSPQDFKVQYSLDNANWTDIPGGTITLGQDWTTGVLNSLTLPAACENQASVYIRWIMTSNTGLGGNIVGNRSSYIDDIYVIGEMASIPPIADFEADQTSVCEGETVNFTDLSSESPSSWSWTFNGGTPATSTDQNPSVVYSTAGTYEVSLSVSNSAGDDTETKTAYITVEAAPTVTAANDGDVCEGEDIFLSATGTGGDAWEWTGPDSYSSTLEDPSIAAATLSMAGDYTVTHTNTTTGCSAQATTSVVVNANPAVNAANNGPLCEGDDLLLDATSGTTGLDFAWSGPDGFTSTLEDPSITSVTTAADGNYTVVATDPATGCSNDATTYAFVNANPTLTASNTGPYCSGEDIQLNANGSGGTSYSWTGPDGFTSTSENPLIPTSTTAMAGTYTVELENTTTGCITTATSDVLVDQTPDIAAANSGPVCEGADLTLSATTSMTGMDFAWSGPDSYSSTVEDPVITAATTAADGTYSVVVTDPGSGCSNSATTAATVNANPTLSASNTGPYCSGEDIQLNATGSGGDTYSWSGPEGFTSTEENPLIAGSTTAMAGTYTVELENTTTGCITSATTDVTVSQTPDIAAANSGPICEGDDLTLNATTGFAGMDFSWTGPDSYSSTVEDPVITAATTAADGTYTVVVTDPGTACSNSATTEAEVNANPTVSAANAGPYCAGEDIQLTATGSGGSDYSWTGPEGFSSTAEDPTIASATTAMAGTYTVTLESTTTGCNTTATTDVVVNPLPDIAAANNSPLCAGEDLILDATNTSGSVDFAWSGTDSFTSTQEDPVITSATTAADGTYSVMVTDQITGCSNTASTTAVINANPVISATNDGPVCENETVSFSSSSSGGDVYSWTGPESYTSSEQNPEITNVQPGNAGTYTVSLENSTTGCVSSATTDLTVNPLPVISDLSNTGPYCVGENAQLNATASGGDTYVWNGPSGFTSNDEDPAINSIQTDNAGVYTLNYSNSTTGCAAASQTTTVEVNALPTVTPGNTGPYCEGDDIQLEGNTIAGASYEWSGPEGFTSVEEDPVITSATLLNEGTYTLEITSADGCVAQEATDVVVNEAPVVDLGADVTQCSGTDLTIDAGAGFNSYSWSTGSTSQSITVGTSGTYSVVVSDANDCEDTDEIVFDYFPETTLTMSSTNETSAGANDGSATVTPTGTSPFDYLWDTGATTQTITGLPGGLYYVTVTDGNACEIVDFVNVGTDNTPPVADFSADAVNVCAGTVINFTDLSSNSPTSWSWDFDGGATNASVQDPTVEFATPGTYDISLTVSNADGSDTEVKTAYITVNANPAISASNAGPYCEGNDVQLSATGSGGDDYAWSGPDGYNSGIENPVITSADLSAAGTYTVELTNTTTGCASSATTDVVIDATPTVSASNTGDYCEGGDVEISATGTGGDTYTWTGPDAYSATGSAQTITSATTAADGMYEVTYENSTTGCFATAQTTVVVNPNPTLSASNTGDYCPDDLIQLNAEGTNGSSYEWSGPEGFTSFVEDPSISNADPVNSGTYTVILSSISTGCQTTATTDVVVNPEPDIAASNDGPYCAEDDVQLTASSVNADMFSWSGPEGFSSGEQNPVIASASAAFDGTYTVLASNSSTGCNASATTNVTVNSNPTLSASNTGPYCEGDDIALNASGSGGTVYSWNGPDGFASDSEDPLITDAVSANAGEYFVTLENSGTACSTTVSTTVNVNPNPVVTASNAGPYCVGETAELSATGSGGDTYTWAGPNSYSNSGQNISITGAGDANSGTYTVSLENTSTGCVASANTVMEVNALPIASVSNTGAYCEDDDIQLNSTVSDGDTFNWTGPNGYTSTDSDPVITAATTSDGGIYTLTYSNSSTGCSVTASTSVIVNANPVLIANNDGPACVGETINLTTMGSGGTEYSWTGPNTYSSTDQNPVITGAATGDAGTYDVMLTNTSTGCQANASTVVEVNANPVVDLGADVEVCDYTSVTLDAGAGYNYNWSTGEFTQTITPTISDTYSVVVTDPGSGCTATDQVVVTINDAPVLTTSTTPENGTGGNDGTATVSISGGVAPYSIMWENGESTETISGLSGGNYDVTVADDNGCTATATANVSTELLPPVTGFTADVTEGCAPLTVAFTDTSTNNPVSWSWDFADGSTSSDQNPTNTFTDPGTYTVELSASNADGSDSETMTITVYDNPVVDLGADIDACNGETVTLDAGAFADYIWTGGETTQTVDLTADASYGVTVSDVNGCQGSDDILVDFHELPDVDLGGDQSICEDESMILDAGAGYDSYTWSTGETTQSIEVSDAGFYTLLVANEFGCEATDTMQLFVNPMPVINLPDTAITTCVDEPFEYTLSETYDDIIWPDGSTGQTYSHTYTEEMIDTMLVTVGNSGCYVTDTLIVDAQVCIFVDEDNNMSMSLYPNPTSSTVNLELQGYRGAVEVRVFNSQGQQIIRESINSDGEIKLDFDMSNFVPGVYFYRIQTDRKLYNHKIIKQ
ncbi:MAG: PKD domain-containing protein [Bacteroidales bacterium]